MRYVFSFPSAIKGCIQLPSSKSISNRALIINALAKGGCLPGNLSVCDDTNVMTDALNSKSDVIDVMAAGTSMRFLTAYFSITPGKRIITGTERMKQRPIGVLVDALRHLGAQIEYAAEEGFPPLEITGTELVNNEVALDGSVSSQYISALLLIAPVLKNGLHLFLTGEVISRTYIELTMRLMKDFGASVRWSSSNSICVKPQPYREIPFTVESDWSAASYWYQMAALSEEAEIMLPGLLQDSYQGDKRCAALFSQLGVSSHFTADGVLLKKGKAKIERLAEDFVDIPDLAQTFAVTCALLDIPFHFTGLHTLRIKETDRMAALITELGKLGYLLRQENDSVLIWDGKRTAPEASPVIRTYEDHRMAMAFAPAAIRFPGLSVSDPGVVTKSYPAFWEDLRKAGVEVREEE